MKRIICMFVCLLFLFSACAHEPAESSESTPPASESTSESTSEAASTSEPVTESAPPQAAFEVGQTLARSYRDADGRIWAMGMAEIVNTGELPLFLDYGAFTLLGADGQPVMEVDSVAAYPQIIDPGESGYYFEVVEPDLPDTLELRLEAEPVVTEAEHSAVRYELGGTYLKDALYGGLTASGKVTNSSDAEGTLVCVAALLLDGDDAPLGLIYTILTEPLAAGASAEFSMDSFMLPPELKTADVASVRYFAYPLQN